MQAKHDRLLPVSVTNIRDVLHHKMIEQQWQAAGGTGRRVLSAALLGAKIPPFAIQKLSEYPQISRKLAKPFWIYRPL